MSTGIINFILDSSVASPVVSPLLHSINELHFTNHISSIIRSKFYILFMKYVSSFQVKTTPQITGLYWNSDVDKSFGSKTRVINAKAEILPGSDNIISYNFREKQVYTHCRPWTDLHSNERWIRDPGLMVIY